MSLRYFEDFHVGEKTDLGSHTVTEAEMLAFARDYDPQRIHVDRAFAEAGGFGGLIASGWHTCAIFMRLFVDAMLYESSAIASPGVDELRWLRPVRAGDTLRAEVIVTEATPSRSKTNRGLVKHDCAVFNQNNERVMTLRSMALFARRPLPGTGASG